MPLSSDMQTLLSQLEPIVGALQAVITDLRTKAASGAWTVDDKTAAQTLVDKFKALLT